MTRAQSHGLYEEYITKFADLLGIFWQYHKEVLAYNSPFPLPFAMDYDGRKVRQFDPQKGLDDAKRGGKPYNPIVDYDLAVTTSLTQSWFRFVTDLGIRDQSRFAERLTEGTFFSIPYEARRFGDFYTSTLFKEVQRLGEQVSHQENIIGNHWTATETAAHGADTGVAVVNRFLAVLGETVNPRGAIMAARTSFNHLDETRRSIGVPDFPSTASSLQNASPTEEPHYDGFAATGSGVNEELLKQFGYLQEDVSGCPAARRVSLMTRQFLADKCGITDIRTPMLTDFLLMNQPIFETRVRNWYRALPPEDKRVISPHERAALEGQRNPHREGKVQRCPFPRKEG